jgi:hypothetical protein
MRLTRNQLRIVVAVAALFNPRFVCGQQTQNQALSNSDLSLPEESAIRPGSIISGYVSPPKYTISRYDEDYSFLANPANRTEALDSIKYIPLFGRESDYFLTLGGEVREQYEYILNDNFGVGAKNSDGYWLQRLMLHSDWHFGPFVRRPDWADWSRKCDYLPTRARFASDQHPWRLPQRALCLAGRYW